MFTYRIWPDYTIQEADEPPYEWKGDDYLLMNADSEEDAIKKYKEFYD